MWKWNFKLLVHVIVSACNQVELETNDRGVIQSL